MLSNEENSDDPRSQRVTSLDLKELEALCQYGAPIGEIAAHFGLPEDEIEALPEYTAAMARGEAKRNVLLRKARMHRAINGDKGALDALIAEHLPTERALQTKAKDQIESAVERLFAEYMAKRSR